MKFAITYYGKLLAIFDSLADAQEMCLSLVQEMEYESFVKEINLRKSLQEYLEWPGEEYLIQRYGSIENYEPRTREFAWEAAKRIRELDGKSLVKITAVKYFKA